MTASTDPASSTDPTSSATAAPSARASADPPTPPRKSWRHRLRFAPAIWAALIGAAATVGVAFIGTETGTIEIRQTITAPTSSELAKEASEQASDLEKRTQVLEDEAADLIAANEGLMTEKANLEAQLTEARAAPTPLPTGTRAPTAPVILRETEGTPVAVQRGRCLDLSSQRSDWGIGSGYDLCYSSNRLSMDRVSVWDHEPTLDECEAQTLYASSVDLGLVEPGMHLCGTYRGDAFAYVRVASVDFDEEIIALDIRVWQER